MQDPFVDVSGGCARPRIGGTLQARFRHGVWHSQ